VAGPEGGKKGGVPDQAGSDVTFIVETSPDAAADPELKVLTLILCAPVVVASWINLQYYASRIDPLRYGSGDKALHHVVGGISVMEGNCGDLKTGLPIQSIHDGEKFVHEPREWNMSSARRMTSACAGRRAVRPRMIQASASRSSDSSFALSSGQPSDFCMLKQCR